MFPSSGLVQGLETGEGTLWAKAWRAEAGTRGVCLRPPRKRTGPGAKTSPPSLTAGDSRPLLPPQARCREALRELERSRSPGSPLWAGQGPDAGPGRPSAELSEVPPGLAAEAKGRHFRRPGHLGEARRNCPAPPASHLHGRDRRVPVGSAGELSTIAAPRTAALLPSGRRLRRLPRRPSVRTSGA